MSSPSANLALQHLGATLRAFRQQRGFSQRALAGHTGIRRASLSQLETGRRTLAVLTVWRLAQALQQPLAACATDLDPPLEEPTSQRLSVSPLPPLLFDAATTPLQRLGATVRQLRQQQGLRQTTLAARTGLSATYLSEIERGRRNLSVLSLLRLAQALGHPVATLLAPLEAGASASPSQGG